ncbi:protein phosphatase Slingshot homolog 1 isoform X2 [Colossoma macropomum]|uniref:protein phosphatase Slingshot homolog 1 isoform X2 n=1 Tax=Colossoma macropomum TaxID=42526 RepID=UPI0018652F6B|nr:protein phosphatase Slingshot homolog 1 isoform X2 [Colossoma macropomum]
MALVTLQRSPTPTAASLVSTATLNAEEDLVRDDGQRASLSLNESFVMVKGAALFLQQGAQGPKTPTHHKITGDLPQHLQAMINALRSEDKIRLAVRLESSWSDYVRYMVVVYTNGHQNTEENILLGMDFTNSDSKMCSIGMVLPLWSDTKIHLNGDGGFSISTAERSHVFKPVSVQAMWSALQVLHKVCEVSCQYNYFPGGMAFTWMGFYESCIFSDQSCINEWNAMTDLETTRPDSPVLFSDQPTERERTECLIRTKLRSTMMIQDLENITSKEIRIELEQHMSLNLREYKEFIDNEMLLILAQMDKATLVFDHLYLGSEWNASNLEELRECGIGYILNVTREIDNFFLGTFCYYNVHVYDDEATDLLAHWNETYNFIVRAKKNNSKCLVHCKMGVSRSASTVIAYAMKEYGWSLEKAYHFVKQKRSIAQPNPAFMTQLAEYEGILDSSKQQHNKLWQPDCDNNSLEDLQAAGASGSQMLPEQELCTWSHKDASTYPCCGDEPTDHLNYNYYFRRLSDTALDSGPSTPVRGLPLLGMEHVFIEIEDVERDALLDDEAFPTAHLGLPSEGTAAQTYGRLEPLEDMRLRLEFSTVEEEDEEEAQKEEAEMAALARGEETAPSGREEVSLANPNRFNNENTNNSNRLAGKRSCPSGFDDSASSGNKMKPSYQSCRDCLHLPGGRRCERRTHRHNIPRHAGLSSISIHATGAEHLSCLPILCQLPIASRHQLSRCTGRIATAPATSMDTYCQCLTSPMSCEQLASCNLQCHLEPEDMDGLQVMYEEEEEDGPKVAPASPGTEFTILKLSLQSERPLAELHQDTHLYEEDRLGRQRPEQLEHMDLGMDEVVTEDMEVDLGSIPSTSLPLLNHSITNFTAASLQHWAMIRSSSSENMHGAQLGLVHQRAQENGTRLRLTGLPTSSRLKRSNSLAKLGGLAISTQDLSFSSEIEPVTNKKSPSSPTHAVLAPLLYTFPG